MLVVSYISLGTLGALCIGLQYVAIKSRKHPMVGNNPNFLQFQRTYFLAYFLALMADWLQGPYLYKLYSHYGFQEDQIAVLYVCGFASTVLLGTWAPILADHFGRRTLLLIFTLLYSVSCIFKLSQSYGILALGRVLGGIATSLLFSSFEAWYVTEHLETNDFPKEWIPVTFTKAQMYNGILAIAAGILTNIVAEWLNFGPVSPFMMSIPCLIMSGICLTQWKENYGQHQLRLTKSFTTSFRHIVTDPRVCLLGIIMSLFESVMYIFVFLWTPILDPIRMVQYADSKPSLGIVFSCFMVCIMIGSALHQLLLSKGIRTLYLLGLSVGLALIANLICVSATHPDKFDRNLAFFAFLLIEIAVGIYLPSMGYLRARLFPEASERSIMNWFRVPLNLIACAVLMMLHNQTYHHGNRLIFVACSGLLAVAAICVMKFVSIVKDDEDLRDEEPDI
eukprot:GHVU01228544.1.p1 GENE.GHVU01228544.1~~GHVU01228544.1.p1  ORF type:complete len:450 (+),score=0.49 GHVU01228544.1:98-1447(+)